MKFRVLYKHSDRCYIIQYKWCGLVWRNWREYYDVWSYDFVTFRFSDQAIKWLLDMRNNVSLEGFCKNNTKSDVIYEIEF